MSPATNPEVASPPAARGMNLAARFLDELGGIAQLGAQSFGLILRGRVPLPALVEQIDQIGLASVSVTTLTAIFSSMVMAVQLVVQMDRFGAKSWVGSIVSLSLVRELGPVLTALMVGGRVGSGIAAELGSMNVTNQVDALRSLGANPVELLVVPRVLAATFTLPLLTAFSNSLGVAAAMGITRLTAATNLTYSFNDMLRTVYLADMTGGLVKTVFFGLLIGLIACYHGLNATGGTQEVGNATTRTVVISSLTILVSDFVLTNLLLGFGL